jgi:hypothetical protein
LKPACVNSSTRPYLKKEKKKNHRKGPVEWFEVQTLSSSPITAKQTNQNKIKKTKTKTNKLQELR